MATAGGLITAAFIKVGVDSPTAAQTASALISLNNLISLLGAERLIYCNTSEGFSVVSADSEYTIGSGGQWSTVRPLAVISCFLRDDQNYDWPMGIMGRNDYNRLSNKSYTARPTALYFKPEYPLAKIIFNTSPDGDYDAYFEFLKNFTEFAASGTSFTAPDEFKEMAVYNLAVSLGEDFDRVVPKTVQMQAVRTREVIDRMLASQKDIPKARFEFAGLGGTTELPWSIVTDEVVDGGTF